MSPKLEDILEIHLLGCAALDQTYHVEDVQQAERTDEDSRACCWLSVGYPGGGGGAEVAENTRSSFSRRALLIHENDYRRLFLPSDSPMALRSLSQLLGHSGWSLRHQCTDLHCADFEYSVHHLIFWGIFLERFFTTTGVFFSCPFTLS